MISAFEFMVAMAAASVLVLLTVIIHYEAMRLITMALPHIRIRPRFRIMVVIFGVFLPTPSRSGCSVSRTG